MRATAVAAAVFLLLTAIWGQFRPHEHELLREVYSPAVGNVAPLPPAGDRFQQIGNSLANADLTAIVARALPSQIGVLWLTLFITVIIAFDFARPFSSRNLDVTLLLALGLMFFDIMQFFRIITLRPVTWRLLDVVYSTIFALNVALLTRAVLKSRSGTSGGLWLPNLRGRALAALALLLLACDVSAALVREPDDAGFFVNLGAQRLRERGRLPYGDPLLTGTPGAAYGPLMYAVHVPFQVLIEPHSPNATSGAHPPLGAAARYYTPPPLATKLVTVTMHLAGVLALFVVAFRQTGNRDVGWGLVALYCGSAFVLGVGGDREFIGGMTFVSHIAPAAITLIAFACLTRPAAAGAMLAIGAGAGFYPAFMLPAWIGFFWRDRRQCLQFVAGFAIAAGIIGGATLAMSRPADGRGRIGTILQDTFGHHTDLKGYGRSPFGFWGQRQGVRHWLMTPTVGSSGFTTPAFLLLFVLIGATFVMARGATPAGLARLSAAIAIAASLIKIQPSGTYVAWAYPLLLIGIFADRPRPVIESTGHRDIGSIQIPT